MLQVPLNNFSAFLADSPLVLLRAFFFFLHVSTFRIFSILGRFLVLLILVRFFLSTFGANWRFLREFSISFAVEFSHDLKKNEMHNIDAQFFGKANRGF